jgi:tryptophan synthase beta chain
LQCKETGEEKVILTALCGHAHLDLPAYAAYLAGEMADNPLPDEALETSLAGLPTGV